MQEDIKKLEEKAAKLKLILEKFPDAKVYKDRFQREWIESELANSQCTNISLGHTCGCCEDAPLVARPYLEIGGERVCSKPYQITIGEKCTTHYANYWFPDWEERLLKYNLPKEVVSTLVSSFEEDQDSTEAYLEYNSKN